MESNPYLPPLGVIEGFYGACWSHEERLAMVDFLSAKGFQSYCYAPKSDVHLRGCWTQLWGRQRFEQLEQIADHAKSNNVAFSVGLTPLDLHNHWQGVNSQRRLLKARLQQIKALQPSGIAILFDDMWGSDEKLASAQVDISHFIADELGVEEVVVCPSYYSFDPLLEELFGAKPEKYWPQLGANMDPAIDFFWTGDTVITEHYTAKGLQDIAQQLQRKPIIWDNSRVNDGRKTSPYLPVKAMPCISSIADECAGFMVNPMNAANLAQLVLSTLLEIGSEEDRILHVLQQQGVDFSADFSKLLPLLNDVGLGALSVGDKARLVEFIKIHPGLYSMDLQAWLEGKFVFDPACLT